jgi:hypothetical protein
MTDYTDTPAGMISRLDAALSRRGEDVVLSRIVKRGASNVTVTVTCRARVTAVSAKKIAGTITQTDLEVILSPTQLLAAGFPGQDDNTPAGSQVPQAYPRITDSLNVQGKSRAAKQVNNRVVGGVWVRTEIVVAG